MKNYKDLEIYQLSYDLAIKIHKFSLKLPRYELFEEGRQIRKSSKGITSCIVEGYGRRRYKADFIKFLAYAHASCAETKEQKPGAGDPLRGRRRVDGLRHRGSLNILVKNPLSYFQF